MIYNWNEAMIKLDAVLDHFRKRDLSYQGRSQVLSKFALSKVYYIAKTLTIPQNYIRQIEIKAKQFIWRDCSPLVKWSLYWAKVRWRFKCTSRAVSFRIFQASLDSVFIGPRKDCPMEAVCNFLVWPSGMSLSTWSTSFSIDDLEAFLSVIG